eukprot:4944393-Pleurochrysis_carterae.AAC.1
MPVLEATELLLDDVPGRRHFIACNEVGILLCLADGEHWLLAAASSRFFIERVHRSVASGCVREPHGNGTLLPVVVEQRNFVILRRPHEITTQIIRLRRECTRRDRNGHSAEAQDLPWQSRLAIDRRRIKYSSPGVRMNELFRTLSASSNC